MKIKGGMDFEFCIERNRQAVLERYGDRLDENRQVKGTDIWFDECWRIHEGREHGRFNYNFL